MICELIPLETLKGWTGFRLSIYHSRRKCYILKPLPPILHNKLPRILCTLFVLEAFRCAWRIIYRNPNVIRNIRWVDFFCESAGNRSVLKFCERFIYSLLFMHGVHARRQPYSYESSALTYHTKGNTTVDANDALQIILVILVLVNTKDIYHWIIFTMGITCKIWRYQSDVS
jgi:hypothetical protein